MATDFTSYLGVKFKFDSAEARADIVKLLNDLDYFEKKLKGNFDTKAITDWNNKIDIAKQGLNEFGVQVDTVTQQSYQNFRAIGQMDRVTREFASGGLTSGLNGLTMFGNSLTRLAVQEGGFKNALTGLVQAFTGPAGIVLAVSAAIGFFEEWQKTQKKTQAETEKHTKELEKQKQAIEEIYVSTSQEATQVTSLVAVLSNENETRHRKIKALEDLKKLNPEIFNGLKLEEGVVIGLNNAYQKYLANLNSIITLKIKQKELEEVTEKILKAQGATLTQEDKDIISTGKTLKDSLDLKKTDNQLRQETTNAIIKQNKEQITLNGLLLQQKKIFEDIKNLSPEIKIAGESNVEKVQKSLKLKPESTYDPTLEREYQNWSRKMDDTSFKNDLSAVRAVGTGGGTLFGMFDENQNVIIEKTDNELKKFLKDVKEGFRQANEEAKRFSDIMAGGITNSLQTTFDALIKGENVFKALSNSVLKFAEDLMFAIIQQKILAAIQGTIATSGTGLAGAAAGGSGFFNVLMNLLGMGISPHAEGGITTGPSIGLIGEAGPEAIMPLSKLGNVMNNSFNAGSMSTNNNSNNGQFVLRGSDLVLALQRSNVSLNLRRGA